MLEPVFTPLSHSIPEDNSLHCCSFSISRLSIFLLTWRSSAATGTAVQPGRSALPSVPREEGLLGRGCSVSEIVLGRPGSAQSNECTFKNRHGFCSSRNRDRALNLPGSLQHAYLAASGRVFNLKLTQEDFVLFPRWQ